MARAPNNSFDLLRLFAASLVLYSHQHVLLGMAEPQFFGWNTFGGAGVAVFFFLSGLLVWSSWMRDPSLSRFFMRRSLRIFPGLWLVVILSVFVVGPPLSTLRPVDYFGAGQTHGYLSTAVLAVRHGLPGVFAGNPYPHAFNGSLWTLPVEFFCYVSVAAWGGVAIGSRNWVFAAGFFLTVVVGALGPGLFGERFTAHFEMISLFWWGVWYGCVSGSKPVQRHWYGLVTFLALLLFLFLGTRGSDRAGILLFACAMVMLAQRTAAGTTLTDRLGDLSYGMYIFAFPVQQVVIDLAAGRDWPFEAYLGVSFLITAVLAYGSWHLVEKRALYFKPGNRGRA